MATLSELLAEIGKSSSSVENLKNLFLSLDDAKKKALSAGDPKLLINLTKLEKTIQKLQDTEAKRAKILSQLQALEERGGELTDQQIQQKTKLIEQLDRVQTEYDQTSKALSRVNEGFAKQNQAIAKANDAASSHWKQHTLLGKAFDVSTGSLARLAAGFGLATLAGKAMNRFMEAAEVRQKILIQNFGDLRSSANLLDASQQVKALDDAMLKATATAQRMGVDTRAVSEGMIKFARIAGTDNPQALQVLTEGAITTSRALGIDVGEAIDFVAIRMDKFGGSASSAIVALNEMRNEAKKINTMLGFTAVRGDDLVRSLTEMSRQTNVYAIDQRLIGKTLRDNITRLQAYGESYDMARMKAEAFTKAITGEAPEWMQVLAGEDILSNMLSAFGSGKFVEQFGDALDAAKPGLAKKVEGILSDIKAGKIGMYEGSRLIQELTAQTSVGMDAINKQILNLAKTAGGTAREVISKQFNVSREVADSMIRQAEDWEARKKRINDLTNAGAEILQKELKVGKERAEQIAAMDKGSKKDLITGILRRKTELENVGAVIKRRKEEEAAKKARSEALQKEIDQLNEMRKGATAEEIEAIEMVISDKIAEKDQLAKKTDNQTEQLKTVEEINQELLSDFKEYSELSGNELKAMLTEMSSIENMLMLGGIASVGSFFAKNFSLGERIARLIMAGNVAASSALTGLGGGLKGLGSKLSGMANNAGKLGSAGLLLGSAAAGYWIGTVLDDYIVTPLTNYLGGLFRSFFPDLAKKMDGVMNGMTGDESENLGSDTSKQIMQFEKALTGIIPDVRRQKKNLERYELLLEKSGGNKEEAWDKFQKILIKSESKKRGVGEEELKAKVEGRTKAKKDMLESAKAAKETKSQEAASVLGTQGDFGTMVPMEEAAVQLSDKAAEAIEVGAKQQPGGGSSAVAVGGGEPYGEITSALNADGSINMKIYNMGTALQSALQQIKKRRAK